MLAFLTASVELQQMAFYGKTGPAGKLALELAQLAGGEIHHLAAAGTNEMVVVAAGTPHQIAALVVIRVNGADKVEAGQQLDGAVYGHAPDAGMLLPDPLNQRCRGEMVAALRDHLQHRAALGRELEAFPAQNGGYIPGI